MEFSPILLVASAVFLIAAVIGGTTAFMLLPQSSAGRQRLFAGSRKAGETTLSELMPLSERPTSRVWEPIGKLLPRSKKDMERLRQRLQRAGVKHPGAPVMYSLIEMVGPFVLGAIPFAFLTGLPVLFAAAIAAGVAFFGPGLYLGSVLSARKRDIENGLPDALDLLVVCIEAGSGMDQAMVKAAEELTIAYPALAEELRIVTTEVRAGKTRLEAFKNLAQRTKVEDVRALVAMLIQTDRFGTSIGQALRTHAEVSRGKRRQRAEEAAQKIGVKLVFPLVLFFFPAFYIVVLGPAILQFVHEFMQR